MVYTHTRGTIHFLGFAIGSIGNAGYVYQGEDLVMHVTIHVL